MRGRGNEDGEFNTIGIQPWSLLPGVVARFRRQFVPFPYSILDCEGEVVSIKAIILPLRERGIYCMTLLFEILALV